MGLAVLIQYRHVTDTQPPSQTRCRSKDTAYYVAREKTVLFSFNDWNVLPSNNLVYESRVTWATSVPSLVFIGLSVLELGPLYAADRQTDRR